jgi:hypothetical protein
VAKLLERQQADRELHHQQLEAERQKQEAAAQLALAESEGTRKGTTYEDLIDSILHDACGPYNGEIDCTRNREGLISRCKKGDWVIAFEQAPAPRTVRVVVETKDSKLSAPAIRRELHEAMRNRDADAALLVLATHQHAPGGKSLLVNPETRQVIVVHARDEHQPLMLEVGIQITRMLALQHAAMQAGAASELDLAELSRLVAAIATAVDEAKATATHTSAARRALDKVDETYAALAAKAVAACNELTRRLRDA